MLLALGACSGGDGAVETEVQSYLDWSTPGFSPGQFVDRRARLSSFLEGSGGGVFLAPSLAGRSHGGTFRQLDDFHYLCGLELPDSLLAVDASDGSTVLFTPDHDPRFENRSRRNDFPGRRLGSDPELGALAGIADVRPTGMLAAALSKWAAEGRALRVDPGSPGEIGSAPTGPIATRSPERLLIDYLQREYPGAELASAYGQVARTRLIKSSAEIELIRRACEITATGIRRSATFVRPGVDERTLEAELEAEFKRKGAQRLAFDSIIKSGPNSLWPWRILAASYDRRNRVMQAGELVIYDVGCELDHYASDVGRTFPVSGHFTDEQRATLEMEIAVADAIIAAVRPGVTFAELQEVALQHIPREERRHMQAGLFFGHHTGLDVGDPNLADEPLAAGMVFTVEPWYYDHERGIAVFTEDMVLVTETGSSVLSAGLPRAPDELELCVLRR